MFILEGIAAAAPTADQVESLVDNIQRYFSAYGTLPRIMIAVLMTVVVLLSAKIVTVVSRHFYRGTSRRHPKFTVLMSEFASKVTAVVVSIISVLIILEIWGINLAPIIAGVGVTGVVLGFALQETIASFFSGMMLAMNNPFRIGDYVTIGTTSGTVDAMDMMSVTLSTPDNKKITMSNKLVWGQVITNYSFTSSRRVDMVVRVSYDTNLDKAKDIIMNLLQSYPETLPSPLPVVEVSELADSSINFIARPWVLPKNYWAVYWKFQKDIIPALAKGGVTIPYNKLDVNILSTPKV